MTEVAYNPPAQRPEDDRPALRARLVGMTPDAIEKQQQSIRDFEELRRIGALKGLPRERVLELNHSSANAQAAIRKLVSPPPKLGFLARLMRWFWSPSLRDSL